MRRATAPAKFDQIGRLGARERCRENLHAGLAQPRKHSFSLGRKQRNAEDAARRGAHGLRVPRAHGSGQAHDAGRAEGLGGAQDCAQVAGVLKAGQHHHQGVFFWLWLSKCSHVQSGGSTSAAMGCGVSVASAESSSFRGRRRISVSGGRCSASSSPSDALRHKNRRDAQARAQRLFEQIRPFDTHQAAGATCAPLLRAGRASARRSSFRRAFCLLSTTRTGIGNTSGCCEDCKSSLQLLATSFCFSAPADQ